MHIAPPAIASNETNDGFAMCAAEGRCGIAGGGRCLFGNNRGLLGVDRDAVAIPCDDADDRLGDPGKYGSEAAEGPDAAAIDEEVVDVVKSLEDSLW